jgi:hypothetical protein
VRPDNISSKRKFFQYQTVINQSVNLFNLFNLYTILPHQLAIPVNRSSITSKINSVTATMDSYAPTDIADTLIEAQFDEVIEAATEVIKAPAEGIEAPAAEVIEAPATSTIEAPAQGTIDTKGTANSTKVPTITNTQPEPPIRIPLICKVIPEVSIYIILNGKTFNRPYQANLYGNNPKLAPSIFVIPIFE